MPNEDLDMCPRCGSEEIVGPTSCRRKNRFAPPRYIRQMRFNCRGCDHVYQFDVKGSTPAAREAEALARWRCARPAQMEPTILFASRNQAPE